MSANITFTEDQIMGLFGELAAEDENIERFKSSFFKNATYEKIHNDRPLRILVAHKGVGKSALFRMSYEENVANNILSLWIRPNDIADLCKVSDDESSLSLIEKWKDGLNSRIIELIMRQFQVDATSAPVSVAIQKSVNLMDRITTIVKGINEKVDIEKSKQLIRVC